MKIIFINVILNLFQDLNIKETRCRNKFGMTRGITSGFTLIELLVAIGIIGILASFLLANFVGVRQRARDGVRKSDLRQIQSALELYRSDQSNYPTGISLTCGYALTSEGVVSPPSVTVYMTKIPCDPSSATPYTYSSSAGTTYSLVVCLENENDSQLDVPKANCSGSTTLWQYTLQNP